MYSISKVEENDQSMEKYHHSGVNGGLSCKAVFNFAEANCIGVFFSLLTIFKSAPECSNNFTSSARSSSHAKCLEEKKTIIRTFIRSDMEFNRRMLDIFFPIQLWFKTCYLNSYQRNVPYDHWKQLKQLCDRLMTRSGWLSNYLIFTILTDRSILIKSSWSFQCNFLFCQIMPKVWLHHVL